MSYHSPSHSPHSHDRGDDPDPWGTPTEGEDSSSLNPNKFFTNYSSDVRGETISVREDPEFLRQIRILIESGKIPAYKTIGDVVRDALRHRFYYLSDNWELPPHMVHMLKLQQVESIWSDMEATMKQMASISDTAERNLEAAFQERDKPTLAKMLNHAKDTLIRLHDPYYSELARVIREYEMKMDSMG